MMHLQLFAQSGLETAELAHMETLSNHMGLFLQVSLTLRGTCLASPWSQNNMQVLTYPLFDVSRTSLPVVILLHTMSCRASLNG